MLVLTRQTDEVIVIGDNIRIMVVAVDGSKVRIGVDAPPDMPVHRLEVYEKIKGK